jgi:biotin transport system ATP-binding protein
MHPIVEVRHLTRRFGESGFVLDDISLRIEPGQFVVMAGRNGSGKTTLIRHFNGLLLPDSGEVILDGISVSTDLTRARTMVGMVFQDADSQIVGETVFDDAAFGPENLGLCRQEIDRRVRCALAAVDLLAFSETAPHQLSGGEKRRLAIAGVLAMEPKVLVLDEPFSNLDYPGVQKVLQQLLAIHRSGRTIVLTTHDIEKVIAHADRLVILSEGRVVRDGKPGNLIREAEAFGIREPCASRFGFKEIPSWLS